MRVKAGKCLQDGVIALSFVFMAGGQAAAQQSLTPRDSVGFALQADVLKHRILVAGDLYRAEKFRILLSNEPKADSLMPVYIAEYQRLYASIPERMLPNYLTAAFYRETIPVVQYTRNPYWVGLFLEHSEYLHPTPAVPDPKHHDEAEKDHAHTHQSR